MQTHLSGSMPRWSRKRLAKSMSQSSNSTTISSACMSVLFTTTLLRSSPLGSSSLGTVGTSERWHFSILHFQVGGCRGTQSESQVDPWWRIVQCNNV